MKKITLFVLPFFMFTACTTMQPTAKSSTNIQTKVLLADGRSSVSSMKKDVDFSINAVLVKLEKKQDLSRSDLLSLIESIQTIRNYGADIEMKSKLKINAIVSYLSEVGFSDKAILDELKNITNTSQIQFS